MESPMDKLMSPLSPRKSADKPAAASLAEDPVPVKPVCSLELPTAEERLAAIARFYSDRVFSLSFDAFDISAASGGRPLVAVGIIAFERLGLEEVADRAKYMAWFSAVERAYTDTNAYHNAAHGADVLAGTLTLLSHLDTTLSAPGPAPRGGAGGGGAAGGAVSKVEALALVLAAAAHDVGHPGVGNGFLAATLSPMAVFYNDESINEMMHACRAFQIMLEGGGACNVLGKLSRAEFGQARRIITATILATDMAKHGGLLDEFVAAQAACPDVRLWDDKGRLLLFRITLHLADLMNPVRPWPLASAYGEGVVSEAARQGDAERAAGLVPSAMTDRDAICLPAAQLGFMTRFLKPVLIAFAGVIPDFVIPAAASFGDTEARWAEMLAAGVRLPPGGCYPPFSAGIGSDVALRRARAVEEAVAARDAHWARFG
ncbi:hypothetical protein Rsub_05638 [Raphidocelis subcapitata]|uniref:Phosphodiesterase n=1 Tax=Raphidocelis subcapitata TaxID=307507 RepID=A0A2V0P758_9CHLO|nr:hypothetical protein Rsub_05638 [Raphidocelis subcapitata]|eukprot:GBF93027.1 hypothetical protein Rsub_05638 [Raphidocelis subcapitata]